MIDLKIEPSGGTAEIPALADLPTVLCGPILKRVTATHVRVWVALCRKPTRLEFVVSPSNSESSTTGGGAFRSLDFEQVGEHLWVGVLTVNMGIAANLEHHYTIVVDGKALGEEGVGGGGLGVDGGDRPSFVLAALDGPLRVAATSCRKPHGEGWDGMAGLADRLSTPERPHLLLLGGDQIYADGVADEVLAIAHQVAHDLLLTPMNNGKFPPTAFAPPIGMRNASAVNAGFQHAYDQRSRLFHAHEFVAMYLLVWSDTLWPVRGSTLVLPTLGPVGELEEGDPPQEELAGLDTGTRGRRTNGSYRMAGVESPVLRHRLLQFYMGLDDVRRLLANCPSYMIWDDHDVADDWFVNRYWSERVASEPLGRETVMAGVATMAVFQSWGNHAVGSAAETSQAPLRRNLRSLVGWSRPGFTAILRAVNNLADEVSFLGSTSPWHLGGAQFFHQLTAGDLGFELLLLDTRTQRNFEPKGSPQGSENMFPELIDSARLPAQVPVYTEATRIVASPFPIVSLGVVDIAQAAAVALAESPEMRLHLHQEKDGEPWAGRPKTWLTLIDRLLPAFQGSEEVQESGRPVIAVSGDVHFSCSLELVRSDGARLVQAVASAAKNETGHREAEVTATRLVPLFAVAHDLLGDNVAMVWDDDQRPSPRVRLSIKVGPGPWDFEVFPALSFDPDEGVFVWFDELSAWVTTGGAGVMAVIAFAKRALLGAGVVAAVVAALNAEKLVEAAKSFASFVQDAAKAIDVDKAIATAIAGALAGLLLGMTLAQVQDAVVRRLVRELLGIDLLALSLPIDIRLEYEGPAPGDTGGPSRWYRIEVKGAKGRTNDVAAISQRLGKGSGTDAVDFLEEVGEHLAMAVGVNSASVIHIADTVKHVVYGRGASGPSVVSWDFPVPSPERPVYKPLRFP